MKPWMEDFSNRALPELDLGPRNGSEYVLMCPSGEVFVAQVVAKVPDLDHARTIRDRCNRHVAIVAALQRLYDETADYIRINNLGDVHHNKAMQMARDALSASPDIGESSNG